MSNALFLRLPADLREWVAEEALRGRSSMNAVVIEAVDLLKNCRNEDVADDQHAAAIELAISLARLPKGTAIILKPDNNSHLTKILVRKPAQADYSILAYVHREQVVVAVDPFTAAAGDGV